MEKVEFNWNNLFAQFSVMLGILFILVALHFITIKSVGDLNIVLSSVFNICILIFGGLCILFFVGNLYIIFKWLLYQATTPEWIKKKEGKS